MFGHFFIISEKREGGHGSLSVPDLGSGIMFARTLAQPRSPGAGSLQLPCPRPSGGRHTPHLYSNPDTSILRDLWCVEEGDGARGRDRAADVWSEEAQDARRPRRPTIVLQPQGHWLLWPPARFGVGFGVRSVAGSSRSLSFSCAWAWCEEGTPGHWSSRSQAC